MSLINRNKLPSERADFFEASPSLSRRPIRSQLIWATPMGRPRHNPNPNKLGKATQQFDGKLREYPGRAGERMRRGKLTQARIAELGDRGKSGVRNILRSTFQLAISKLRLLSAGITTDGDIAQALRAGIWYRSFALSSVVCVTRESARTLQKPHT